MDGWEDARGVPLDVQTWAKTNLSESLSETKKIVAVKASKPEKKHMEKNLADRIMKDKLQGRVKPGSSTMMVPIDHMSTAHVYSVAPNMSSGAR